MARFRGRIAVIGFNLVPQKNLENGEGMPGESGKAGEVLKDAYPDKAGEQVLLQSKTLKASDSQFKAAVRDVTERLRGHQGGQTWPPLRSRRTAIPRS